MSDIYGEIGRQQIGGSISSPKVGGSVAQQGVSGSADDERNIGGNASLIQRITGELGYPSGGRKEVVSGTTAEWNAKPQLKAAKDIVYVYTDHNIINGQPVPGIKIGDGVTYLIDLPFVTGGCEVTEEQINFWNEKVSVFIDPEDPTNLVFTTE